MIEVDPAMASWLTAAVCLAVLRLLPPALSGYFETGDMIAHRLFIQKERQAPFSMWRAGKNYLFLFHTLAGLTHVPTRLLWWALPLACDLAVMTALWGAGSRLMEEGTMTDSGFLLLPWAWVLYPGNIMQFTGPRSYGLNERVVAECTFAVLSLVALVGDDAWITIPVIFVLTLYLLFSSRFATQAIIFLLFPALILSGKFAFAFAVVAAFLTAWFLPGADYGQRFLLHLDHVLSYRRFVRDPNLWIGRRNRPPDCNGKSGKGCLAAWANFLLFTNGIGSGIVWHAPVVVTGLVWMAEMLSGIGSALSDPFLPLGLLVVLAVLLWLASSVGTLKIIGEAERYLAYAAAPALLLLAMLWPTPPQTMQLVYVGMALLALAAAIIRLRKLADRARRHRKRTEALIQTLKACMKPGQRVAAILPTHDLWLLLEHLDDRVSWYALFLKDSWVKNMRLYPYPAADYILREGYDLLVTDADTLKKLSAYDEGLEKLRSRLQKVEKGPGSYAIYSIDP